MTGQLTCEAGFVLLVYHGPNPALRGSDRWKVLPEAEQKAIDADYAELNKAEGMTGTGRSL